MADEPVLLGTRRTPSEQDLFDWYMLGFITIKEYLEGCLSPPTREPEGSGGSRVRE